MSHTDRDDYSGYCNVGMHTYKIAPYANADGRSCLEGCKCWCHHLDSLLQVIREALRLSS